MGASQSDGRGDLRARQQQRAQWLLERQVQEVRVAQYGLDESSVIRPVQQPGHRVSRVFKNPVHLQGKTLELACNEDGVPASLSFKFDASTPGTAVVRRAAVVGSTENGCLQVLSAGWSSSDISFEVGLGQTTTVEWSGGADLHAPVPAAAGACQWPLVVELQSRCAEDDKTEFMPAVEWTMCRIIIGSTPKKCSVEVAQQQVCGAGVPAFNVLEVFGSEKTHDGNSRQECIVCQNAPRDTAVLPCRHMCLCSNCADYIRTRVQYHSFKCPICRNRISRMMSIDKEHEES